MTTESSHLALVLPEVVTAQKEHLAGAKRLAESYKHELGFIHRATLQRAIETQCLLVAPCQAPEEGLPRAADIESELAGMLYFYVRRDQTITLYTIAVAQAYQRRGLGRQLFEALIRAAQTLGKTQIRLKCPAELSANGFYQHLGLQLISVEPGKHRSLNIWLYSVQELLPSGE
jgi:GNAT superfamily N-acetyltransferase